MTNDLDQLVHNSLKRGMVLCWVRRHEVVTHDFQGNPVVNSRGEPFYPPIYREVTEGAILSPFRARLAWWRYIIEKQLIRLRECYYSWKVGHPIRRGAAND